MKLIDKFDAFMVFMEIPVKFLPIKAGWLWNESPLSRSESCMGDGVKSLDRFKTLEEEVQSRSI